MWKERFKGFHVLLFSHLFIAFVMNYIVVQQSDIWLYKLIIQLEAIVICSSVFKRVRKISKRKYYEMTNVII
jgi:hypothetical protein